MRLSHMPTSSPSASTASTPAAAKASRGTRKTSPFARSPSSPPNAAQHRAKASPASPSGQQNMPFFSNRSPPADGKPSSGMSPGPASASSASTSSPSASAPTSAGQQKKHGQQKLSGPSLSPAAEPAKAREKPRFKLPLRNTQKPPSSSQASGSSLERSDPFAASSASTSSQQPDYFGGSHSRPTSSASFVMPSSSSSSSSMAAPHAQGSQETQDHPWANLFGQSGLPTATPGMIQTPGPRALDSSANLSLPLPRNKTSAVQTQSSTKPPTLPSLPRLDSRPLGASLSLPIPRAKHSVAPSDDMTRYQRLSSSEFATLLEADLSAARQSVLVIDIRPASLFESHRVKGSVNICAPSTLLKRSGVTVYSVEEGMLRSRADQEKFQRWKNGPMKSTSSGDGRPKSSSASSDGGLDRIVVLDTETTKVDEVGKSAVGGGGPCLIGMLRKFDAAGFAGHLCWLAGGFTKFAADSSQQAMLLESGPVADGDGAAAEANNGKSPVPAGQQQIKIPGFGPAGGSSAGDRPGQTSHEPRQKLISRPGSQLGGLPMDAFTDNTTTRRSQSQQSHQASGADDVAACNPFFDNIRQNRELQHGITERISLELPELGSDQKRYLPEFITKLANMEEQARAEVLAQSFFEIEKAEQARLMATMRQHAAESGIDPRNDSNGMPEILPEVTGGVGAGSDTNAAFANGRSRSLRPSTGTSNGSGGSSGYEDASQLSSSFCQVSAALASNTKESSSPSFPFSIAAAIEKGGENRYDNIWTYEHSRVRLDASCNTGSDYLNGSYVEPMKEFGCYRRYIATQAPLPATFDAFWTTVWQENCRTIAMLTREYESGRVQSHNYWDGKQYGPYMGVEVVAVEELDGQGRPIDTSQKDDAQQKESSSNNVGEEGGFFVANASADGAAGASPERLVMIRRKIRLTNRRFPTEGPRIIEHLQYVGWPDYSIPEDPEALLAFTDMASRCQQDAHLALLAEHKGTLQPRSDRGKESAVGPLLLHCSAGVGRTGTYIVIDTVLDVLRRQRRQQNGLPPLDQWDSGLEDAKLSSPGVGSPLIRDVEMKPVDSVDNSTAPDASSGIVSPQTPSKSASFALNSIAWPPRLALDGPGTPAGAKLSLRGAKRSLKRELSPSAAMDVDSRPGSAGVAEEGSSTSGSRRGSATSVPPIRRNRSSSSDVSQHKAAEFELASSPRLHGWGGLGISQPDGLDTPSRALDSMNLGFGSSATPTSSTAASRAATPSASGVTSPPRRKASLRSRRPTYLSSAAMAENLTSGSSGSFGDGSGQSMGHSAFKLGPNDGSATQAGRVDSVDLVRHATDVAREQRMSSVQTQRQYVFCYLAVTHGVLREVQREGLMASGSASGSA
ncbi:unnamed protein product [Parajaminaea phylloscopi]